MAGAREEVRREATAAPFGRGTARHSRVTVGVTRNVRRHGKEIVQAAIRIGIAVAVDQGAGDAGHLVAEGEVTFEWAETVGMRECDVRYADEDACPEDSAGCAEGRSMGWPRAGWSHISTSYFPSRRGNAWDYDVLRLGAVVAGFVGVFPGIRLEGSESALEEGVVYDVAFAVFSADDPVSALDVAEAEVGGDGLVLLALRGVDEQGAAGAKCTHDSSAGVRGRHGLFHSGGRKER